MQGWGGGRATPAWPECKGDKGVRNNMKKQIPEREHCPEWGPQWGWGARRLQCPQDGLGSKKASLGLAACGHSQDFVTREAWDRGTFLSATRG